MKCLKALLLAPLVLGACEKSNNFAQLKAQANAVGKTYAPIADELDTMLGLDGAADPILTWNYSVPGSRHLLVVLDVRTRRTFASRAR